MLQGLVGENDARNKDVNILMKFLPTNIQLKTVLESEEEVVLCTPPSCCSSWLPTSSGKPPRYPKTYYCDDKDHIRLDCVVDAA